MLKFNKNLSIIHAYLCADGYVIRNPETSKSKYYYMGLRNMNDVLLKDFEDNFYGYFKIKPRRCKDGRSVIQNKATYYLLTEHFSYYSREWKLPQLSKNNLKFWLRTFFDCEGWVFVKKSTDRHIGADSVNHNGLRNIKTALNKFNIGCEIKTLKNRDTLRLLIYGRENLMEFQKNINFLHPEKKIKLQEAIDSYENYNWKFPKEKEHIKKVIINLIKEKVKDINSRRFRICSNIRKNLILTQRHLNDELGIFSIVSNKQFNGIGTPYYELSINRKQDRDKIKELIK